MKGLLSVFIMVLFSCSFEIANEKDHEKKDENDIVQSNKPSVISNEDTLFNEFKNLFSNSFDLPMVFGQDYYFDLKKKKFSPAEYKKYLYAPINDMIYTSSYMESEYFPLGFIKSSEQQKDFLLLGFFEPPFKRSIVLLIYNSSNGDLNEKILLWEDDQIKKRVISIVDTNYIANITYIFDTRNILDSEIKSNEAHAFLKKSKIRINSLEIIEDTPLKKINLVMEGNTYLLPD
jgi:hypothetical protein